MIANIRQAIKFAEDNGFTIGNIFSEGYEKSIDPIGAINLLFGEDNRFPEPKSNLEEAFLDGLDGHVVYGFSQEEQEYYDLGKTIYDEYIHVIEL